MKLDAGSDGEDGSVASAAVLDELVKIRQREGVSSRKLREHASNILLLRATTDEMQRLRFAAGDRHVAALSMLRCAVKLLVPRTDYALILSRTLNVAGDTADLLDRRRSDLQAMLHYSEKELRHREQEAYEFFAATLVMQWESPCGLETVEEKLPAQLALTITATPEAIAQILKLLALETRPAVQLTNLETLYQVIPNARAALLSYQTPHGEQKQLVEGVLRRVWPTSPPRHCDPILDPESMANLLLARGVDLDVTYGVIYRRNMTYGVNLREERFDAFLPEEGADGDRSAALALQWSSMLHFAEILLEVDHRNMWREVLEPPAKAADVYVT